MYTFTPRPNRRLPFTAVLICAALGIALFLPISDSSSLLLWLRTGGLWAFFAAFVIADKFLLTSYIYSLEETDGAPDLVIEEIHFRRRRIVCRISLDEIVSMKKGDKTAPRRGLRVYNYRAEFPSRGFFLLRGEDADGEFFIKFAPDTKMADIIDAFLSQKN